MYDNPLNQQPGSPPVNPYAAPSTDARTSYDDQFGLDQEYVLASRGSRFAGALIDGLVTVLACVPAFVLYGGELLDDPSEDNILLVLAIPIVLVTIVQWYLISTSGQSIAKKLLGMKIVRLDGSDVGFVHGVLLRVWVMGALQAVPFVGNFVGLADALAIFGEEHRCLHDQIAGTRVISI
jgi:uncharacterized RDD family membrane protein YckC